MTTWRIERFALGLMVFFAAAACSGGDDSPGIATPTAVSTGASSTTTIALTDTTTGIPSTSSTTSTSSSTTTTTTTTSSSSTTSTSTTTPLEAIDVARGFVSIGIPDGWAIASRAQSVNVLISEQPTPWTAASRDGLQELLVTANGPIELRVYRERFYYGAPNIVVWHNAVSDLFEIEVESEASPSWTTSPGKTSVGSSPSGATRLDSVAIGDQLLTFVSTTPGAWSGELVEEVDTILRSVRFDTGAVPDLAHATAAVVRAPASDPSVPNLEVTFLVPGTWARTDDPEFVTWQHPERGNVDGFVDFNGWSSSDPIEVAANVHLTDEGGFDWLDLEADIEQRDVQDHEVLIAWSGPSDQATAAIVFVTDRSALLVNYVWTPSVALTRRIVDSVTIFESALIAN